MSKSKKKKSPALKVGDFIKPIKGRTRSNNCNITQLETLQVTRVYDKWRDPNFPRIDCKIVKGYINHLHLGEGDSVELIPNAFELYQSTESCSIWN